MSTRKFAVMTDGEDLWVDTIDGTPRPARFDSFAEALEELEAHFDSMFENGIDFDMDDYRIVEVKA